MQAVLDEAQQADRDGFDSVWLFDHLMDFRGNHTPDGPYDSLTLMVAVGAVTERVRLAWAMLNPSFRNPAVLAKSLATLDHISRGRVICSLGAGWFKDEYQAYNIPLLDDHEARIAHEREVVQLLLQLWARPAPERVTFQGHYVQVHDLPFNPSPFQKPHPPIWIGGDSEATLELVKELADGWVMLKSGNPDTLSRVLSAPDWPSRPMVLVRNARMVVAETREAAMQRAAGIPGGAEIVGSVDECAARVQEIESWGINYLRLSFETAGDQLPRRGCFCLCLPREAGCPRRLRRREPAGLAGLLNRARQHQAACGRELWHVDNGFRDHAGPGGCCRKGLFRQARPEYPDGANPRWA
jgi:alkanesulfonate monooxygenase SsuD/methylene tetrahydromethanopterin reductase-like flavin-dependent oxidoreductase (luciferase family)